MLVQKERKSTSEVLLYSYELFHSKHGICYKTGVKVSIFSIIQVAKLPKGDEVEVPGRRGPRVPTAAKKKVGAAGPVANRINKTVNSTTAVTPVTPTSAPTSIPGSTATTTVPLPHAQHNSLPHQVRNVCIVLIFLTIL